MLLNRLDTLRVRAADGLASTADQAELSAAGVDALVLLEEQSILHALLAESLDAGSVPELADGVIGAIGIDDVIVDFSDLVTDALSDAAPPDIAAAVLGALDFSNDLGALISESLDAGDAPELADPILEELALQDGLGLLVSSALADDQAPDLANDVLTAIGGEGSLSALIAESLDAGEAPELSDAILDALGMTEALSGEVRAALDGGEAPDLWTGISAQLDGSTDAGDLFREALTADAGEIDIADEVMAELGLVAAEAITPAARRQEAEVVPLFGGRSALMGTVLAIAAALLLYVVPGAPVEAPIEPSGDSFAYNIQDNNQVEIEELESAPEAMVHIFQTEAGAPTIIFIDEMEEVGAESSEGEPL
ncbi:MAG: hypothetical protein P8R54_25510 [Myxococcota bacterium]|nr:hypothetical protein [Myxococcota bacterium]